MGLVVLQLSVIKYAKEIAIIQVVPLGVEAAARWLQGKMARKEGQFVHVDCLRKALTFWQLQRVYALSQAVGKGS